MPDRPPPELNWLCEHLAELPLELRKSWVSRRAPISIKRQCELLGISRSTLYYKPVGEDRLTGELLAAIRDKLSAEPRFGSRRLTQWLRDRGHAINRKRVIRLLRLIALESSADSLAGDAASRAPSPDPR